MLRGTVSVWHKREGPVNLGVLFHVSTCLRRGSHLPHHHSVWITTFTAVNYPGIEIFKHQEKASVLICHLRCESCTRFSSWEEGSRNLKYDGRERPDPGQYLQPRIFLSVPSHATLPLPAANQIRHSLCLSLSLCLDTCVQTCEHKGQKKCLSQDQHSVC